MSHEPIGMIRGVRVAGADRARMPDTEPVDIVIAGGLIADIAPTGHLSAPRGSVFEADGAWIVPGLWDHHVHVVQWALAAERVALGDTATAAEAIAVMAATAPVDGRRVGSGFRDALWPDGPSLEALDAATGDVPTYLINADVHSVWLNSAALRAEGFTSGDGSGVLREEPAFEVSRRLNAVDAAVADRAVATMARSAAARGVVGVVDLDMAWNEEAWTRRIGAGFDLLRVEFGIYPRDLDRALDEGLRTGDVARGASSDLARVGPFKAITDGSLGTRTAACSHGYPGAVSGSGVLNIGPELLRHEMTRATAGGLACAIHAIGDVAVAHALDVFAATGATGTIEHAQLVAHADLARLARLGVGASVQPEHALDDRDLVDAVWAGQTALAYPLRSLQDAGVSLLFGSDAPVAPLDPWRGISAAVHRTTGGRAPWRVGEAVDPDVALAASTHGGTGRPAAIDLGEPADLVVCAADPRTADAATLAAMPVVATFLGGRPTFVA